MKGLCLALNEKEIIIISDGDDSIIIEYYVVRTAGCVPNRRIRVMANPKYKIDRVRKKENET